MKILSITKLPKQDNWDIIVQIRLWKFMWLIRTLTTYRGYSDPFYNLGTLEKVCPQMQVTLTNIVWKHKHIKRSL